MAFDQALAARIRLIMRVRSGVQEKKMFGCLCFLLYGHACVGVWKDSLIARVGQDQEEAARREEHVKAFDITGKPMRNWVQVAPPGIADEARLAEWVGLAAAFVATLPAKDPGD